MRCMTEKGLQYEPVWQANYMALMPSDHPLAEKDLLSAQDFGNCVEIAHGDDEVPYIRTSEAETVAGLTPSAKRILVYDRAMQLDLLQTVPGAYCWASAQPKEVLEKYGLAQRRCNRSLQFKDVLISRSGYHFSKLDRAFIDILYLQRNAVAYGD